MQTTSSYYDNPNRVAAGSEQSYGNQEAEEAVDGAIGILPVLAAGTLAFAHGSQSKLCIIVSCRLTVFWPVIRVVELKVHVRPMRPCGSAAGCAVTFDAPS